MPTADEARVEEMLETMATESDIVFRLRAQADEIDRAVSRNKTDVEEGAWCEIEYMREAATEIEKLRMVEKSASVIRESCAQIAEKFSLKASALIRAAPISVLEKD